jgi:hypothetical protein
LNKNTIRPLQIAIRIRFFPCNPYRSTIALCWPNNYKVPFKKVT